MTTRSPMTMYLQIDLGWLWERHTTAFVAGNIVFLLAVANCAVG
jgi:hypothetical protein